MYGGSFLLTETMLCEGSYRLEPCCVEVPIDWDHAVRRVL